MARRRTLFRASGCAVAVAVALVCASEVTWRAPSAMPEPAAEISQPRTICMVYARPPHAAEPSEPKWEKT